MVLERQFEITAFLILFINSGKLTIDSEILIINLDETNYQFGMKDYLFV